MNSLGNDKRKPISSRPDEKVKIPPTIWAYWDQGFDNAPTIVQICVDSWRHNSGITEIHLLDSKSIWRFLDLTDLPLETLQLSRQKQANIFRLALLAKYGGIWVDASVFISREVEPWLRKVQSSTGLFLYQVRNEDRFFTNSVIASAAGHDFVVDLLCEHRKYFSTPRHDFKYGRGTLNWVYFVIYKVLVARPIRKLKMVNSNWSRWPLSRLPFHPFRIFHYLGNSLIHTSQRFLDDFDDMTFVPASCLKMAKGKHSGKHWDIRPESIEKNTTPFNKFAKGGQSESALKELRKHLNLK